MKHRRVRIGISAGDINGIGPEVALKAAYQNQTLPPAQLILISHRGAIAEQAEQLGLPVPPDWNPAAKNQTAPLLLWDPEPGKKRPWTPGKISITAAKAAAGWIRQGVSGCLDGTLDALVTAPISKEGFHRAGIQVPGHTEMLAELTGTRRYAMMLFGGPLRVILATRHVRLASVSGMVTEALIIEQVELADQALRWIGVRRRRIAVCGLNPHAGEGGDIGDEEQRVILPAIRKLKRRGYQVHGPLPGDTVFHQAAAGMYDVVIAMYHDQGLAPLKLIAFDSGVNLTLGLPIVRTSPDHGTAFAIAGQNRANPSSMIEAIRQAARLARRNNPWARRG